MLDHLLYNNMKMLNGGFQDNKKIIKRLKKVNSSLIVGYQIFHNYVRSHYTFKNKTLFEICGI